MELFVFQSAAELDGFLAQSPGASFLQSWRFGEIMSAGGEEFRRLGVRDEAGVLATATLFRKKLPLRFSYWLAPRGPIFSERANQEETIKFLFTALQAVDRRALFFRFEPAGEIGALATGLNIQKTIDLEPAQTLVLDLGMSEDSLAAAFHPKTRYNLRLAEKKGVVVREIKQPSSSDWREFWRLMNLTGARDGFRLHPLSHYENLVRCGGGAVRLFMASYSGREVAAGLFSFWNGQATYLHGASDNEYRQAMAPHLLQWTVIRQARREGYQLYDFYGIDEAKWPGVTRFKLGFGGQRIVYPGTFDAVFRPALYALYTQARKLRRAAG